MTVSSQTPPRCVAVQIRHREPAGYRIRLGERAGDRSSLDTLRGPAFSIVYNLPAPFFESASHHLPTAVGKLRTAIERTNSLVALAVRPFISRGQRLILQFGTGPVSTAGKCFSFLRALHQDPAKSLGVAGILFTPFNQHRLPKSAGLSGLVSASDTHRDTERKRSWVTSDGSNLT